MILGICICKSIFNDTKKSPIINMKYTYSQTCCLDNILFGFKILTYLLILNNLHQEISKKNKNLLILTFSF